MNMKRFFYLLMGEAGIGVILIFLCLAFSLYEPAFRSGNNISNIFTQISINTVISVGMTFVILLGGIDLSVGSVLAFASVFTAYSLSSWGWPLWLAVGAALVISALVGLFNGAITTLTGIAPFVVTLSTQTVFKGVAMLIADGRPIRVTNQTLIEIGTGYLGPVALPIIYAAVIMLICYLLLNRTKFGRNVYALGGNRMAARFAGIRIARVEILVYVISGFLSGIAGVVLAGRLSAGSPNTGTGYELDAIAAVVLGGASFTGGVGTVGGTLVGAIVIGIINNGLNMLNVASFWQYVVKGIVILLAVLIDVMRKRNSERRKTALQIRARG